MFCFQCQETAKNTGCTVRGMCGKPEETANLQDLLIFVLKGISIYGDKLKELGAADRSNDDFIAQGLFATITNANWDNERFVAMITDGLKRRDQIKAKFLAAYREKNGQDFDAAQHAGFEAGIGRGGIACGAGGEKQGAEGGGAGVGHRAGDPGD